MRTKKMVRFPGEWVFVIGAGHFGERAARILKNTGASRVVVVDVKSPSLTGLQDLGVQEIQSDGIAFLMRNLPHMDPSVTIVPALPLHLAFEWLKEHLATTHGLRLVEPPETLASEMPFSWKGSDGSLLVSYSDFMCPDNCPEPDHCTVTGERRDPPLYGLLEKTHCLGWRVHVIRSRQLAPGLGGYSVEELTQTAEEVGRKGVGKWLLATACKCHGVVTSFEVNPEGTC